MPVISSPGDSSGLVRFLLQCLRGCFSLSIPERLVTVSHFRAMINDYLMITRTVSLDKIPIPEDHKSQFLSFCKQDQGENP